MIWEECMFFQSPKRAGEKLCGNVITTTPYFLFFNVIIGPIGLLLVICTFSSSSYSRYGWGLRNWNNKKLKVPKCEISY
jgi:hypothetical protein